MDNAVIHEEAFNLLCGELLGEGAFRKVFACTIDPALVVKVETRTGSFHNVQEWRTWDECQFWKKGAAWLAPCVSISPYGTVLLQKRVEPLRKAELPEKMPAFMRDVKAENFGLYEGRVVCSDYAFVASILPIKPKKFGWDA